MDCCETDRHFDQRELNDLVRDLNLSKDQSELLASRLQERGMLRKEVNVTLYRTREKDLLNHFKEDDSFVYCPDSPELINNLSAGTYDSKDWRLFLDSSKKSLKCVLLHNGNKLPSIPIGHSVWAKESYDEVKKTLKQINYDQHNWVTCVDLKMANFLLGQQGGYTKYPCFHCLWDSRACDKHWVTSEWPARELVIGENNVINKPLVGRQKVIFPPLHIKLRLMKQYVKALDKNGNCFVYLRKSFPAHGKRVYSPKKSILLNT